MEEAAGNEHLRQLHRLGTSLEGVAATITKQGAQTLIGQVTPVYNGSPKEFKAWIKNVEKAAHLTQATPNTIPLIAYQSSAGPVSDFIARYMKENLAIEWEVLKRELTSRFSDVSDAQYAFSMLRSIRQKPDENVQLFAERILALYPEAYPNAGAHEETKDLIQGQLTNFFIDGLRDTGLKVKLMRESPKTLTAAVNTAMTEQNLRKRFSLRSSYAPEDVGPEPMEIDRVRTPKRCYICRKPGHFAKDCKRGRINAVNYPPPSSPIRRNNENPDWKANMTCWSCGQKGHLRRECPNPPSSPHRPRLN